MTSPAPPSTSLRRILPRLALAVGLTLAIVAFYVLGLFRWFDWETIRANVTDWERQVQAHLIPALGLFFLIYVAVTALSLPVAVVLTLLAGALFGRWLGTLVVSVASTLGATLAFLSSRYLLRDWVQTRFGKRLGPLNRGVEQDGAFYLFTLRLVAVVPFWLVNLGMGLTPMSISTFALVSWIGMLLGTILYVNIGTELQQVESPTDLLSWPVLGSLALLGVVPLLVRWILGGRVRPR